MKRKILALIIAAVSITASAAALTACDFGGDNDKGNTGTTNPPVDDSTDADTDNTPDDTDPDDTDPENPDEGKDDKPVHRHDASYTEAKAAECTVGGNIEYWYCADCGKYFSDDALKVEITKADTETPSNGHTEATDEGVDPTCTKTGLTEGKHCEVCKTVLVEQKEIPADGHTEVTDEAVEATCTESGLTEGKHCEVCKTVLIEQEVVPAAHKYEDEVCKSCGKHAPTEGLEFDMSYGDLGYTLISLGTAKDLTEIYIPEKYKSYPVTWIASSVFSGCSGLTHVEIPDGVTLIGRAAFYGCSKLTDLKIPDSVTRIDMNAFANCKGLIETEGGIQYVDGWAVGSDGSATEVTLRDGTRGICDYLFLQNNKLTSATLPDSLKYIGAYAFSECQSLTSVTMGKGVKEIGAWVFYFSHGITSIVIPNGATGIGREAFYGCNGLTSIVIPDTVTTVGSDAFKFCDALTIYCGAEEKPEGWYYSSLGGGWNSSNCPVVWNCENNDVATDGNIYIVSGGVRYALKDGHAEVVRQSGAIGGEVIILDSIEYKDTAYPVTRIGVNAFYRNGKLTDVSIPDSVTSVGDYAFFECDGAYKTEGNVKYVDKWVVGCETSATKVTLRSDTKGIAGGAFRFCNRIGSSLTLPAGVVSIGENAFWGCSKLVTIMVPEGVTHIGAKAFDGCTSLSLFCEAEEQPDGWETDWNPLSRPVTWGYKNN